MLGEIALQAEVDFLIGLDKPFDFGIEGFGEGIDAGFFSIKLFDFCYIEKIQLFFRQNCCLHIKMRSTGAHTRTCFFHTKGDIMVAFMETAPKSRERGRTVGERFLDALKKIPSEVLKITGGVSGAALALMGFVHSADAHPFGSDVNRTNVDPLPPKLNPIRPSRNTFNMTYADFTPGRGPYRDIKEKMIRLLADSESGGVFVDEISDASITSWGSDVMRSENFGLEMRDSTGRVTHRVVTPHLIVNGVERWWRPTGGNFSLQTVSRSLRTSQFDFVAAIGHPIYPNSNRQFDIWHADIDDPLNVQQQIVNALDAAQSRGQNAYTGGVLDPIESTFNDEVDIAKSDRLVGISRLVPPRQYPETNILAYDETLAPGLRYTMLQPHPVVSGEFIPFQGNVWAQPWMGTQQYPVRDVGGIERVDLSSDRSVYYIAYTGTDVFNPIEDMVLEAIPGTQNWRMVPHTHRGRPGQAQLPAGTPAWDPTDIDNDSIANTLPNGQPGPDICPGVANRSQAHFPGTGTGTTAVPLACAINCAQTPPTDSNGNAVCDSRFPGYGPGSVRLELDGSGQWHFRDLPQLAPDLNNTLTVLPPTAIGVIGEVMYIHQGSVGAPSTPARRLNLPSPADGFYVQVQVFDRTRPDGTQETARVTYDLLGQSVTINPTINGQWTDLPESSRGAFWGTTASVVGVRVTRRAQQPDAGFADNGTLDTGESPDRGEPDTGERPDSGVESDSGRVDTGERPDGGVVNPDADGSPDAMGNQDAAGGQDARPGNDATPAPDARADATALPGDTGTTDRGSHPDAQEQPRADSGVESDSGPVVMEDEEPPGGCSCNTTEKSPHGIGGHRSPTAERDAAGQGHRDATARRDTAGRGGLSALLLTFGAALGRAAGRRRKREEKMSEAA